LEEVLDGSGGLDTSRSCGNGSVANHHKRVRAKPQLRSLYRRYCWPA
jgi:hypothetical protein